MHRWCTHTWSQLPSCFCRHMPVAAQTFAPCLADRSSGSRSNAAAAAQTSTQHRSQGSLASLDHWPQGWAGYPTLVCRCSLRPELSIGGVQTRPDVGVRHHHHRLLVGTHQQDLLRDPSIQLCTRKGVSKESGRRSERAEQSEKCKRACMCEN